MATTLDPAKELIDKTPTTQSYQSFLSLFPNLATSGLTEEYPTPIPMMFEKGVTVHTSDEDTITDENKQEIVKSDISTKPHEEEKVQEVALGHGQSAFSLDNQDGKLLVDNFVVEETSSYLIDSHLPHSTMYPLQPYSLSVPPSTARITEITEDDDHKEPPSSSTEAKEGGNEPEKDKEKEWDGGFQKTGDKPKFTMKPKQNVNNNLVVLSIEEEEDLNDDDEITPTTQNTSQAALPPNNSSNTSTSTDTAEFSEVEKFSIDEDFDYDNIVLARKYSPETERRLNGKFKGYEDELSKLNVHK